MVIVTNNIVFLFVSVVYMFVVVSVVYILGVASVVYIYVVIVVYIFGVVVVSIVVESIFIVINSSILCGCFIGINGRLENGEGKCIFSCHRWC